MELENIVANTVYLKAREGKENLKRLRYLIVHSGFATLFCTSPLVFFLWIFCVTLPLFSLSYDCSL